MPKEDKIADALQVLGELGMPRAQRNDRSALCLLALLNLTKGKTWLESNNPLIGITPMMEFAREHYKKPYAPNSRETFRRQTIHQMVTAGIALYNPDNHSRPINSPKAVYQIEAATLTLLRSFGTAAWNKNLETYLKTRQPLTARYAKEREMKKMPVRLATGDTIRLSPGEHSQLIKAIVEEFAPRHVPGGVLIYAGDTGEKWGYFDKELLTKLGVEVDGHGKMPDVVLYYPEPEWLLLVESVTSHGPVDGKRHGELSRLFAKSEAGLVYVTAFPSRAVMSRYLGEIAWETEVWCADAPSHLIHFNGARFLGPYEKHGH
jgi:BsuBI/PstI restriction endonuclease domain/BsuBI/PstI restriction endonuclease HTH domain